MHRGVSLVVSPTAHHRDNVYESLIALVPEGAWPVVRVFATTIREDDPRLQEVYRLLERFNLQHLPIRPVNRDEIVKSRDGYFTRRYVHLFTDEERDAASHLLVLCSVMHEDYYDAFMTRWPDNEGPRIGVWRRGKSQKFLYDYMLLSREKFKPTVEAEQFVGVQLVETIPVKETRLIDDPEQPTTWPPGKSIYLLDSTIELPPMPASEIKVNPQEPRHWVGNPGFDDAQPVYRRSDIDTIPPFDYARMWEYCNPNHPRKRCVIVSQRFRQFCLKHKMRFDFVPVKYVD